MASEGSIVTSWREKICECDYCGKECHCDVEICAVLCCTSRVCDDLMIHQACVEKYLKGLGFDKARRLGFPCPRGKGRGTKSEPCNGKVEKTHPIIPRNEEKKQKKIIPPEIMQQLKKPANKVIPPQVKASNKIIPPQIKAVPGGVLAKKPKGNQNFILKVVPNSVRLSQIHIIPEASVVSDQSASEENTQVHLPIGYQVPLTKTQRKNLKRQAKKKLSGIDPQSEHTSTADDAQSISTEHSFDIVKNYEESDFQSYSIPHNFITNPAEYEKILGLYSNSLVEESESIQEDRFETAIPDDDAEFQKQLDLALKLSLAEMQDGNLEALDENQADSYEEVQWSHNDIDYGYSPASYAPSYEQVSNPNGFFPLDANYSSYGGHVAQNQVYAYAGLDGSANPLVISEISYATETVTARTQGLLNCGHAGQISTFANVQSIELRQHADVNSLERHEQEGSDGEDFDSLLALCLNK